MEYPLRVAGQTVRTNRCFQVRVPFDGVPVATVFEADEALLEAAIAAAKATAPLMREMTAAQRSAILRKAQQRLVERSEEFAKAIAQESGKPIREARLEADRAAQTLLFSAEEANRLCGEVVPMEAAPAGKGHWAITVREPVGIVAAITPFNFPLNLSLHKIGPALAAGNVVVHKPASATPVSALKLADLLRECGLPEGALQVVTGPGGRTGEQLVTHPDIAMITFTGSYEVGVRLRNLAGMKRVTLELGNNGAVIICADANLDEAAARCVAGSYAHSGQVCISVQRIFVEEAVRAEFVDRFVNLASRLRMGHPLDEATDISSLINECEAQRVEEWIAEAVAQGARLVAGGVRRRASMTPAVVTDVPPRAKLAACEAFGPVVGINGFRTLDEAIERVNDSDYGLQAAIYTRDLEKAFTAARRVHVGGFLINQIPQYRVDQMPYGGVKRSGAGREGPRYAIEEMTESKLICWKL